MRLSSRAEALVLPVLALLAEGAWLAVVYAAVETVVDRQPPLLGTFELAASAAIAAALVRARRLDPDADPLTFFAAVVAIGAAGWLWSASARDALLAGDLFAAIGQHPGGWLTGVAFLRGTGRGLEVDDRAMTRLVTMGVPALAVPWAVGHAAVGGLRDRFVDEAFVASLTFIATGFMAAGLARLQAIGTETGVDWRANRSWLGLVLGVLLVVLALGIPAASLLGLPVETVARGLLGPVATLIGYVLLAIVIPLAFLTEALYAVLSSFGIVLPPPMTPEEAARLIPAVEEYGFDQVRGGLLLLAIFWALLGLLALIVMRTWLRRRAGRRRRPLDEERFIRFASPSLGVRLPRLWPERSRPRLLPYDAVSAYLASLEHLERWERLMRRQPETPAAHARRVADAGPGDELRRLAADYALARYAGRTLTPAEDRRGLARWRRLRDRMGRRGG